MAQRLTFAAGTAAEWAASSLILAVGQPGWDIENKVLKVGNGISTWAALPVYGSGTTIINNPSTGNTGGTTIVQGMANPMLVQGDTIVGGAQGVPVRLPGNISPNRLFLSQQGTGLFANAPLWTSLGVSDVGGAAALQTQYLGINTQSGTSYTLALGDPGKIVRMTSASANTVVIPLDSAIQIPVNSYIDITQYGAGVTSIGFTNGVNVRSVGGLLTVGGQYQVLRATKVAANEWLVTGVFASISSGGGNQGGTTNPGGGTTTPTAQPNLISSVAIQNAEDFSRFGATGGSLTTDTTIFKSGGSSIKMTPTNGGSTYPYLLKSAYPLWAPVTPGTTYTAFCSIRQDTTTQANFVTYIQWLDSTGTEISIGSANATVAGVAGNWVQVSSTGAAPSGAVWAAMIVEYQIAGPGSTATIHYDEFGIVAGTSTIWSSGTGANGGGTGTTPATITDAGFTYSNGWLTGSSGGSEHYSSTTGSTATVSFTLNQPGNFSLKGKQDSSNGTVSISVDGGTAISVSESATGPTDNATLWTSPTLAAGNHTIVVTVTSPDGSIQGASITNGAFTAPTTGGGGTGSGGTGTVGSNTTKNGKIIGGAASGSNPSGYLPPSSDAFPGYTNILTEDFSTNFAEGRNNGIAVLGSHWFDYEGQPNGNYEGMNWDTDQISASGSVVTMRNTNKGGNCQALTPIFRDSANVGKNHYQQAMLYGKTVLRMKGRGSVGYKIAFLMWPTSTLWQDGEIDFPEGDVVSRPGTFYTMTAASHHLNTDMADMGPGPFDAKDFTGLGTANGRIDDGLWHTFTINWDPAKITFEMDGITMGTYTDPAYIPSKSMRWTLQCEPTRGEESNSAMYIDIDWVAAYKRG